MDSAHKKTISNYSSAVGNAVGALIERALNRTLLPIVERNGYLYITTGPKNVKTGRNSKLLLTDSKGIKYNVDAVITNDKKHPLVLVESKFIRYTKHNRDKGSWIYTAHPALRKRFSSIRGLVAVIVGSWSETSKAMMRSADIKLFEIPFATVCALFDEYNVDLRWDQKDKEKPIQAWIDLNSLSNEQKLEIGNRLIVMIEADLDQAISQILDDTIPHSIQEVEVQFTTNRGEVKIFSFGNVEEALKFLQELDEEEILNMENAPTLFENLDTQPE